MTHSPLTDSSRSWGAHQRGAIGAVSWSRTRTCAEQGGDPKAALRGGGPRKVPRPQDTQQECDDTSHGIRVLSAKSAWVIYVPVYLTGTLRSQRFSRSQRFFPTRALWLCFTPHPPLGFRSSELSSIRSAVSPLGDRCSLAVGASSRLGSPPGLSPRLSRGLVTHLSTRRAPTGYLAAPRVRPNIIQPPDEQAHPATSERLSPTPKRIARRPEAA